MHKSNHCCVGGFHMKEELRVFLRRHTFGMLILNYRRIVHQKINLVMYDDETAIKKMYKKRTNRDLNLENPLRYTEKLQWNKLNHRNPLMTKCVDKIEVRKYLIEKGYEKYLTHVVGEYRSIGDIKWAEIPEKCIFKASHGSSMHIVKTRDMRRLPFMWRLVMNSWLKMNIYIEGREWPYKNVRPGIICEEFIEPKTDNRLKDYKFFCFSGNPKFIQVDVDLLSDHHINFYDIDWNLLPIRCQYPNSKEKIPKPLYYSEMLKIASDLSEPFPHVRVDFYQYDDQLKIGELTFFDGSGFYSFHPDKYDFIFGKEFPLIEYKSVD